MVIVMKGEFPMTFDHFQQMICLILHGHSGWNGIGWPGVTEVMRINWKGIVNTETRVMVSSASSRATANSPTTVG